MSNKYLTLCIDFEEFSIPHDFGATISQEDKVAVSLEGLEALCDVLKIFNMSATFFVTEGIAGIFPELLKSLIKNGHEIALHSIIGGDGRTMALELQRQKTFVEAKIQQRIYGCRSHKFIDVPSDILREAGFSYDNSLHPTFVPGRYCNILKSRNLYLEKGVIRVPVSVTPFLRLPLSWIWFRNFGFSYARSCSQMIYLSEEYINIYFHSWDFANISHWSLARRFRPLVRNTGEKMLSMLSRYLAWCSQKRIAVVTLLEYIRYKHSNLIPFR
ncbi:MAG: polysaccharide deacetylase family protein [Candidatus Omnitrophota bacterium]